MVERPHPVVLAPHDFCNIKATVKVSSTENGVIFGNIGIIIVFLEVICEFPIDLLIPVYDTSNTSNVVVLNTIHIDIMDYIIPATCTDTEFRQMWQDFEWENKVRVYSCSLGDLI